MFRAIAAAALLLFAGPALAAERSPLELTAFQDKTDVRKMPEGEWQRARPKHPLPARSTVRTGAASWASLLFIDQTQIKLSAHALFQVKAISRDGQSPTIVEIRKGKAWTQSKTPPKHFIMRTPAVNAGIQGTDWVVEVAEHGTATSSVLSGEARSTTNTARSRSASTRRPSPPRATRR